MSPLRSALCAAVCGASLAASACGATTPDGSWARAADGSTSPSADTERPSGDAASATQIRGAADATAAVTSGRFEIAVRLDQGGDTLEVEADGSFDADTSQLTLTLDGSGGGGGPLSGTTELVAEGNDLYVRGAPLEIFDRGPDTWVLFDGGEATDPESGDALGLGGLVGSLDADAVVDLLDGADGEVERLGSDDVRGEPCEHLRVPVSVRGIADGLAEDADGSELFGLLEDVLGADLPADEVPVDVWTCEDGLVHRLEIRTDGVEVRAELFDLGEPIEVTPPADAERLDVTDWLDAAGSVLDELTRRLDEPAGSTD